MLLSKIEEETTYIIGFILSEGSSTIMIVPRTLHT